MESWQSKLKEMQRVPAKRLLAGLHPENWRGHSVEQRQTMEAVLERVGWVAPVIVSQRTGRVIDGELRIQIAADLDLEIEVTYVDLDEEEERLALATFDAVGEMAIADAGKLDRALGSFRTLNPERPALRTTSVPIASMVEAAASGTILGKLWMAEEAGGDEDPDAVLADDHACYWVRVEPGVDESAVVAALELLRDSYDGVRVEGMGFERLG